MEPRPEKYNGELGTRQDNFTRTLKLLYYNKSFDTKRQLGGYGERESVEHEIANSLGVESWKVLHKFWHEDFAIPLSGHPMRAARLQTRAALVELAEPKSADLENLCNAIRSRALAKELHVCRPTDGFGRG